MWLGRFLAKRQPLQLPILGQQQPGCELEVICRAALISFSSQQGIASQDYCSLRVRGNTETTPSDLKHLRTADNESGGIVHGCLHQTPCQYLLQFIGRQGTNKHSLFGNRNSQAGSANAVKTLAMTKMACELQLDRPRSLVSEDFELRLLPFIR